MFYTQLIELLGEIHHRDNNVIILGDFNARVYTLEGPAAPAVFGRYQFHRGAEIEQEEDLNNASLGVIDNRARMLEMAPPPQNGGHEHAV